MEEDTLSEYPLTIEDQGFDMTSLMAAEHDGMADDGSSGASARTKRRRLRRQCAHGTADTTADEKPVHEAKMVSCMFGSIGSNDLASLKSFLDSPDSGIGEYVRTPSSTATTSRRRVFSADTADGVRQVNPDSSLSALGFGAQASASEQHDVVHDDHGYVFYELPADTGLVEDQYDVVAGRWPERLQRVRAGAHVDTAA